MKLTPNQERAIGEAGNLLVVAAAGAGKTGTLVQRCLRLLLRPVDPVPVRRLLVVTFTEAAAAEVRERLRQKLEEAARSDPANENLHTQLANIDSAYICTLHSFCFQLIRRHVLELGIDPAVRVLEGYESEVEFQKTFDMLLHEHYGAEDDFANELKAVISAQYRGWEKPVGDFVRAVHEFTQTRPHPERWFEKTLAELAAPGCPRWHQLYRDALRQWRDWWLPYLEKLAPEIQNAQECVLILRSARDDSDFATIPSEILERDKFWKHGQITTMRSRMAKLFEEAKFLQSLQAQTKSGKHALEEDWDWMRQPLRTLLQFAQEFDERFYRAKTERGVLDFHDLEQLALKLLIDPSTGEPTTLAREWQERFEAVFVDEYQDINAAQDLILSALSSAAQPGNRFLVGDVKQSIYRFRQADPSIFQKYARDPGWKKVSLSENFRSHEGILRFINPIFRWLMRPVFGGLEYTDDVALKFGSADERQAMRSSSEAAAPVELHLWLTDQEPEREENGEEEPEIENAEREARMVAERLRALKEGGFTIYIEKEKQRRPVEWRDMVVLLRAAKNKLETFAKAFEAAGVPLQTKRSAFFTTQEVLDLCSLLQILDNPLQDIPLVAVLHSPIVGLTVNELASIRIHLPEPSFWRALNEVYERKLPDVPRQKIERFLKQFHNWRDARRCASLAQRLEAILADTGYGDWLLSQPRGRERAANVRQLVRIARQFDEARAESLYLFLKHIEELQDAAGDIEPAGCVEENAVRLMTVHQSKGLEFPVVAIADLGKQFNFSDLNSALKFHDQYGVCVTIKPPHTGQRYPSLPLWLARRAERLESRGEEMRILYVALTRAQNHLLLFGSTTERRAARWDERATETPTPQQILQHHSWLDWFGTFASLQRPGWFKQNEGTLDGISFRVYDDPPILERASPFSPKAKVDPGSLKIDSSYLYRSATKQAAKTSVTKIRQNAEWDEEEAVRLPAQFRREKGGKERGLAMHLFLENFSLSAAGDLTKLRDEAERLVREHFLTPAEAAALDLEAVNAFWTSKIGRELLRRSTEIKRELPFTFRATRGDLAASHLGNLVDIPDEEFIVIQGVADLVLIDSKEIWLIDFKTDQLKAPELKNALERYRPQVLLYATALSGIYRKPVTRKGIFFLSACKFEWLDKLPDEPRPKMQLDLGL